MDTPNVPLQSSGGGVSEFSVSLNSLVFDVSKLILTFVKLRTWTFSFNATSKCWGAVSAGGSGTCENLTMLNWTLTFPSGPDTTIGIVSIQFMYTVNPMGGANIADGTIELIDPSGTLWSTPAGGFYSTQTTRVYPQAGNDPLWGNTWTVTNLMNVRVSPRLLGLVPLRFVLLHWFF